MNPSGAVYPGTNRPPTQQQHPTSNGRVLQVLQQGRPETPLQSSNLPQNLTTTSQTAYISPHSSTSTRPPHHSPYTIPQQHPGEPPFFGAHPSPYSSNSITGSFPSSEPNENMAVQAAMSRPHYPPMSSYQTPQSNSPASMNSPQTDSHGRPMYPMPQMPQQMYYHQSQYMPPNAYSQHPPPPQHHAIHHAPGMLMSQSQPQQPHQIHQQAPPPPPPPAQHHGQPQAPPIDRKPSPSSLQRSGSVVAPPHGTPQTPSSSGMHNMPPASGAAQQQSAAPGPIPATTPLVVRQDHNGVQWIAFEYSRDRVKMEYTIRCDVESVNVDELSAEFKSANCVYPRACCNKDQYKGNRLHYESECNAVGWALAQLNPPLREKRGLIQRAVDSWRNSNQDMRLRSRRVRRMAKMNQRKNNTAAAAGGATAQQGNQASPATQQGVQNPQAANDYKSPTPVHHHQAPPNAHSGLHTAAAPNTATSQPRYNQNFYPSYPQQQHPGQQHASMPPMQQHMDVASGGVSNHQIRPTSSLPSATAGASSPMDAEDEEDRNRQLFGDLPESKRRKFILVDDAQRGTRVRVRVMLDQVRMDDMPDAHLKINAVFPRSYYPRQIGHSPGGSSPRAGWDDEDDHEVGEGGESGVMPTRGKTFVNVPLMEGGEAQLPIPRMSRSRRSKEVALNELGCRMAWGQARTFSGRTLFLQRSLDAYRNKMRSQMVSAGQDPASIASHFETRPGKRKFVAEKNKGRRGD